MKQERIDLSEQSVCRITLSASAQEFAQAVAQAQAAPGAPADRQELWYNAMNALLDEQLPGLYRQILAEHGLTPVARPECKPLRVDETGFAVLVLAPLDPQLTVKQCVGLTAHCTPQPVTDSQIEAALARLQRQAETLEPQPRPAQLGDTLVLDYAGTVNGAPIAAGKGEGQQVELGSNTMLPGFEQALVGRRAGERFVVPLCFPQAFPAHPELAGKPVEFAVTLHTVALKRRPALDDAFAQSQGAADMAQLRARTAADLAQKHREAARENTKKELKAALAAQAEGALPSVLVQREYARLMKELLFTLQMRHMTLEQLLAQAHMTRQQLEADVRRQAQDTCRGEMALLAVARQQGLQPTPQELQEEIARRAAARHKPVAEFLAGVDRGLLEISYQKQRALDYVLAHANVVEQGG